MYILVCNFFFIYIYIYIIYAYPSSTSYTYGPTVINPHSPGALSTGVLLMRRGLALMLRVATGSRSKTHEDGTLATLSSFQIHPLLLPSQVFCLSTINR